MASKKTWKKRYRALYLSDERELFDLRVRLHREQREKEQAQDEAVRLYVDRDRLEQWILDNVTLPSGSVLYVAGERTLNRKVVG